MKKTEKSILLNGVLLILAFGLIISNLDLILAMIAAFIAFLVKYQIFAFIGIFILPVLYWVLSA